MPPLFLSSGSTCRSVLLAFLPVCRLECVAASRFQALVDGWLGY